MRTAPEPRDDMDLSRHHRARGHGGGFTLVEVIVVLIILAILAAIITTSYSSVMSATAKAQAHVIRTQLRYAQSTAMKRGGVWGMSCDGTDYWLFTGSGAGAESVLANRRALPGESGTSVALADNDLTATAFTVFFDPYGIPYTAYTSPTINTPVSDVNPVSIAVTSKGTTETLDITPNTGFVP